MTPRKRGSGTTTMQLQELQEGDVFLVLTNAELAHISHLCAKHGIPKIKIQSVRSYLSNPYKFTEYPYKIECDHSCYDTDVLSHEEKQKLLFWTVEHNQQVYEHRRQAKHE